MTTCLTIPQCSKCKFPENKLCSSCSNNHTLDTTTNTCKCQNNPPCSQYEICVQEITTCLPSNLCMKSPFCTKCSEIDPTWCESCVPGFFPDNFGVCQQLPCDVENCIQCDPKNENCSACVKGLFLSENNTCECEIGSNKACSQGETCNADKKCEDANICLKDVNCVECDDKYPENCLICRDGYSMDWGTCVKSFCKDKFCNDCDEGYSDECYGCQRNYQKSPVSGVCECVLGSDEGCDQGSSCSREMRVCVLNDKCKEDVKDCLYCWSQDQGLCGQCQEGFILSNDRKICLNGDSCMQIKGCQKCNFVVPSLCTKCDTELIGNGETCASNKISTGGLIAIILVAILVLIGCVVGGVFLIKRLKNKTQKQVVQNIERPLNDYI